MSGTGNPLDSGSYLQWECEGEQAQRWFPKAVVLRSPCRDELWRCELPPSMRAVQASSADPGVKCLPGCPSKPSFLLGLEWTDTMVAFADSGTLLVLARADGRILFQASFDVDDENWFWFDRGQFRVLAADGSEEGGGEASGGHFFARGHQEWLYFNGTILASIDLGKPAVRQSVRYDRSRHHASLPRAQYRATIPLGHRTVVIEGVVYMH